MGLPPYPPVPPGGWRARVGLRRCDPPDWLLTDGRRPDDLAAKQRLPPQLVWAAEPGTEAAGEQVRRMVEAHLGPLLTSTVDGALVDASTGLGGPAGGHPLLAAAMVTQEDLCLLARRAGRWVLVAGSVCAPSRWSLAGKGGRPLLEVHGPVPAYAATLHRPAVDVLDRLGHDDVRWRSNWTLLDDPAPFQPDAPGARPVTAEAVWLRVERQTLRRVGDGHAVFTIRTYVEPLTALDGPTIEAIEAALADAPDDVVAYKGWQHLRPAVLAWCAERRRP